MTRKYIVSFAKIFNDIKIQRFDSAGTVQKTIKVPVSYAGKSKIFYLLNERKDINVNMINTILPRISFIITGATINRERLENNMNQIAISNDGDVESLMYSGVPYDFAVTMSIWGKNMDDVLQIFEQIAPYFKPDYTITLNEIKELNIHRNVPVTLNDIQFDVTDEMGVEDERNIFADLSFTIQGYLYPPITDDKIIKIIDVDFKDFETFQQLSNIHFDETNTVYSNFAFDYNSQFETIFF